MLFRNIKIKRSDTCALRRFNKADSSQGYILLKNKDSDVSCEFAKYSRHATLTKFDIMLYRNNYNDALNELKNSTKGSYYDFLQEDFSEGKLCLKISNDKKFFEANLAKNGSEYLFRICEESTEANGIINPDGGFYEGNAFVFGLFDNSSKKSSARLSNHNHFGKFTGHPFGKKSWGFGDFQCSNTFYENNKLVFKVFCNFRLLDHMNNKAVRTALYIKFYKDCNEKDFAVEEAQYFHKGVSYELVSENILNHGKIVATQIISNFEIKKIITNYANEFCSKLNLDFTQFLKISKSADLQCNKIDLFKSKGYQSYKSALYDQNFWME